jgi:two-component system, OmpR family, sensor histidine kinase KdpD
VNGETGEVRRGRLRIYLGAAPGVGKTFAMLGEGRRRAERGTDVVVGFVEAHGRARTAEQVGDLEVVPRRDMVHRGAAFEEMDVDAVLARQPLVALVDELAHTNVPGSRNEKRWQDIDELLEAGIDVISTVNIQHLESLNDTVERITGVRQRETVPDAWVRQAEQIELIDQTPEALRRRMAHGNIYAPDKIEAALGNYFRAGNLGALRELALLWLADRVDEALGEYREAHGIDRPWETRERVVVALTGAPGGDQLIRRAARMAARSRGDLLGVHVSRSDGLATATSPLLDDHRRLLTDLGGEYHEVVGADVASGLVDLARAENATQLVLGASRRTRVAELWHGSVIGKVLRMSGPIDVHVTSTGPPEKSRPPLRVTRSRDLLPRRRLVASWAVALVGLPTLTVALDTLGHHIGLPTVLLLYLALVVVVATLGGLVPAVVAAIAASVLANWFFTEPVHTFSIGEAENVVALLVFLGVGVVVSLLVRSTLRRSAEATRARLEAAALARSSATLVGAEDPLPRLVQQVHETFGLEGCAVVEAGERVVASAGRLPPDGGGGERLALGENVELVLVGPVVADDLEALQAFAAQLRAALEQERLRREAAKTSRLSEANELRTALLRAVSHDLRTPLASIKAAVTSLLQHDVDWTLEATTEFLQTIDEEADRLNRLVGNLLDMSRLETGALSVRPRPVGLEEVVAAALSSLPDRGAGVVVDVPETLPAVVVDPALLERAVANLVANASQHTPSGRTVRVEAREVGARVDPLVIDRGPGVPEDDRERVFAPFQRLGDTGSTGVGLGLAVARGFVEAVGGQLTLEETPGGGLTVVVTLPRQPVRPAPAVAGAP